MENQLHIYMNNPTAGKTDGTEASSGTGLTPISVTLDASKAESAAVKCAVRCDDGYKIDGDVTVSLKGTSSAKWKLAKDNDFADSQSALEGAVWQDKITLADVADGNVIFWAKAMSSKDEPPQKDTSVSIEAVGKVVVE
ncbi:hypothetical protein [Selenomonas ruminantium]|uniref:Uncharacterized protein n=1 Tax=Selenomonas ruminantium TaxID=971 RepID=A0A1I0V6A8_SELRU|nr:hypothetical protein [Selenomonas ruminantium]SFA71587.1 hypothetical protein SAMN05216587_101289 [Selenomonas ruminantium]